MSVVRLPGWRRFRYMAHHAFGFTSQPKPPLTSGWAWEPECWPPPSWVTSPLRLSSATPAPNLTAG